MKEIFSRKDINISAVNKYKNVVSYTS